MDRFKAGRFTTGVFHWQSAGSGRDRPDAKNSIVVNHAPPVESLKESLPLCDPCWIQHRVRGFNSRCPPNCSAIPVTNDQPGVAARISQKQTGKTAHLEIQVPLIPRDSLTRYRPIVISAKFAFDPKSDRQRNGLARPQTWSNNFCSRSLSQKSCLIKG